PDLAAQLPGDFGAFLYFVVTHLVFGAPPAPAPGADINELGAGLETAAHHVDAAAGRHQYRSHVLKPPRSNCRGRLGRLLSVTDVQVARLAEVIAVAKTVPAVFFQFLHQGFPG